MLLQTIPSTARFRGKELLHHYYVNAAAPHLASCNDVCREKNTLPFQPCALQRVGAPWFLRIRHLLEKLREPGTGVGYPENVKVCIAPSKRLVLLSHTPHPTPAHLKCSWPCRNGGDLLLYYVHKGCLKYTPLNI